MDISDYKETVLANKDFFKHYYYHSIIDLNLVKLDSILKNGILSKKQIERNKLPAIYTHLADDEDSKNGFTYVSLSQFDDNSVVNKVFESFAMHALTSVSVMVNKDIKVYGAGEQITYFSDEVFAYSHIPKEHIRGIIYPSHLTNLSISEIPCLPKSMACYEPDFINKWIEYMEKYFGLQLDRRKILDNYRLLKSIIDQYTYVAHGELVINDQKNKYGIDFLDVLASELQTCWSKKVGVEHPTFTNVISYINDTNLPIYEISKKSLKKIN